MINNCLGSLRGGVPNASHKTFCFVLKKVFAMQNTRRAICQTTVESSGMRARTINSTTNPGCICLILTYNPNSFQNTIVLETSLPDDQKMVNFRSYSKFVNAKFKTLLLLKWKKCMSKINYDTFENVFNIMLNKYAPIKIKYIRANNAP